MSEPEAAPEPDRVDGAPHPRETLDLIGQSKAEAAFLEAYNAHRLHHGWLISGPRGVGKATLAWRIARFLLAEAQAGDGLFGDAQAKATSLDISADHPVSRRMRALSEPRLKLIRRTIDPKTNRLRTVIVVEDIRELKGFFNLSASDGGRRVVIVDSADEMNTNAANALLKVLEEPPKDTTILLVSHQPSGLLPTVRSRCRELRCSALTAEDMAGAMSAAGSDPGADAAALAELAAGSVGEAARLTNLDGMQVYAQIVALFATLPRLDRSRALALAESAAGKGAESRFDLILRLLDLFLARTARTGVSGPPIFEAAGGEAELMRRLAPGNDAGRHWAELQQTLGARARHGRAVNLDPAALILDMVFRIDELAGKLAAR